METNVTSASQDLDNDDGAERLSQHQRQPSSPSKLQPQHHRHHHEEHHHVRVSSRSTLSSMESSDLLATAGGGSARGSCACGSSRRRARRRRRWPEMATLGRALFVISVAFFVVGVLVTVFGFNGRSGHNDGAARSRQLPLQVFDRDVLFTARS